MIAFEPPGDVSKEEFPDSSFLKPDGFEPSEFVFASLLLFPSIALSVGSEEWFSSSLSSLTSNFSVAFPLILQNYMKSSTAAPPTFVPKFLFILHIYISSIVRKVEEIKQMYEIAQFFFSIKSL